MVSPRILAFLGLFFVDLFIVMGPLPTSVLWKAAKTVRRSLSMSAGKLLEQPMSAMYLPARIEPVDELAVTDRALNAVGRRCEHVLA